MIHNYEIIALFTKEEWELCTERITTKKSMLFTEWKTQHDVSHQYWENNLQGAREESLAMISTVTVSPVSVSELIGPVEAS